MKILIFKIRLEKLEGYLLSFEKKHKTIFFLLNLNRSLKIKS